MSDRKMAWHLSKLFLFRSQGWFSFNRISTISVLGIAIGVAALVVAMAISSGFHAAFKESIFGLSSHAFLASRQGNFQLRQQAEVLAQAPEVERVLPALYQEGMLAHQGRVSGAVLKGIALAKPEGQALLKKLSMTWGNLGQQGAQGGMVLGKTLAERLDLKVNDRFQVIVSDELGHYVIRPEIVAGIFHSGMYEFDERFVLADLSHLQALAGKPGEVTGVEFWVNHPEEIVSWVTKHENLFDAPFHMVTWREFYTNLFAALRLERVVFFLVILPIVVVGALTVVAGLLMFIQEKQKSIVILKALGMARTAILKIFVLQGVVVGSCGLGLGLLVGTGINIFLKYVPIIPVAAEVYLIDRLPIAISISDLVLISAVTLLICVVATLVPATKAAHLQPAEVLHGRR